MSVAIFILTVLVSFVAVRIGAIAFQLTGLEWSQAKFQSLSCFTGTGFTTNEAELIVGHRRRRKIASVIMVMGNAGLIVLIASFANSLQPSQWMRSLTDPVVPDWLPSIVVPAVNIAIMGAAFYIILRLLGRMNVSDRLTGWLRNILVRRGVLESLSTEELITSAGKQGILRITIGDRNPMIGQPLKELPDGIQMLAIETDGTIRTDSPEDLEVGIGDSLICYGELSHVREQLLRGN
jgi:hypothetical protein